MPTEQSSMKLKNLIRKEPDLGKPHIELPDLSEKVILIIGATYASGFGYNFAKVASTEAGAKTILTASKRRGMKNIERIASEFASDIVICDVTSEQDMSDLYRMIKKKYGRIDSILVTPAFLNPKYFTLDQTWDNVTKEDKNICREISVYPTERITHIFDKLLSKSKGSVYGFTFSIPDLPGYVIGPAKKELETLVIDMLAREMAPKSIRCNIICLGPFESVSSSAIPEPGLMIELMKSLRIKQKPYGEVIRESVATLSLPSSGMIYELDNGLRKAFYNEENSKIIHEIYKKYF